MLRTLAAVTLLAAVSLAAQAPAPAPAQPQPPATGRGGGGRGGGGGTPVTALQSPEVHPDRTFTFRFRAPQATQVDVVGEVMRGAGPRAMTKGEDGVWTATIGPLPPEIWIYNFRIQGVDIPDPANPAVKPVPPG